MHSALMALSHSGMLQSGMEKNAIKQTPEDFEVEEIPAYLPGGTGEHLYLWIEKRGMTTRQAVQKLARAAGKRPGDVGVAGLKDSRAVTRQWVSIHTADAAPFEKLDIPGLRVLQAGLRAFRHLVRSVCRQ